MRVMLVNSFFGKGEERWIPLGLAYMSAVLKNCGSPVCVFDFKAVMSGNGMNLGKALEVFKSRISDFNPEIIGINSSSMNIHFVKYLFEEVLNGGKAMKIIGGHHAAAFPQLVLEKIGSCDVSVYGEGEKAICEIASGKSLKEIRGISYKAGEINLKNEPEIPLKLDELPYPDYGSLDMDFYTRPNRGTVKGFYGPCINVATSRGCPMRCSFCSESTAVGHVFRGNSPGYVSDLISFLEKKYGIKGVYFSDPDFLADEERGRRIFEKFIESGLSKKIKWSMQTRSERISGEILDLAVKAGCEAIEIGVENFSQGRLDFIEKKVSVEANEKAIRLCAEKNINVHAYVITGIEGETIGELEETLGKVRKLGVTSVNFNLLRLFPGTRMYEKYGGKFFEEHEWNEKEIREFYSKDRFSGITESERSEWMRKRYAPAARRIYRRKILKKYGPGGFLKSLAGKSTGRM